MTSLLLAGAALAVRSGPEPKLSVTGDVAKKSAYTAAELGRAFAGEVREVAFVEKGVAGHARAFPLASLVAASAPRLDPRRKHAAFSLAVVAVGPDGYSATFSGAELSPELGREGVWVALDWNDRPLTGDDAPARLIVPGDAKPSRWVHGVRTVRVVNLAPKGHGPAPEGAAGRGWGKGTRPPTMSAGWARRQRRGPGRGGS